MWEVIVQVDRFEHWWPWFQEVRLDGNAIAVGSVFHGVIAPPLPYRMRISIKLVGCDPPNAIDALVEGDLQGQADLRLADHNGGTLAEVGWTLEMMQRPMRIADRVAHPLLQWGHDRVVEMTVKEFRRRIESDPGLRQPFQGESGCKEDDGPGHCPK